ncbi:MAG: DNA-3-methyladenine glycosylase family protein [Gemmatimonadaceae bacterium]
MPPSHAKAIAHLSQVDPVLGRWIAEAGPCTLRRDNAGAHFHHIARSIVYQQLSGAAASTIWGRVLGLYGGTMPEPAQVIRTPDATLRGLGLSGRKVEYIKDLARHARSGALPEDALHAMDDDEVIAALTQVRGIGEWTAQMFLMFRLGRPDVLPVLDLGVKKAVQALYGLRKLPSEERLAKIGRVWAPHRTVAAWYLWRRVDNPPQ